MIGLSFSLLFGSALLINDERKALLYFTLPKEGGKKHTKNSKQQQPKDNVLSARLVRHDFVSVDFVLYNRRQMVRRRQNPLYPILSPPRASRD